MDVPKSGGTIMTYYSYFLKFQGFSFITFIFMAYFVKFGVVWHDAGAPLSLADLKPHPYMNMILMVYAVMGFYMFLASFDPAKYKFFLSFATWGGEIFHGIIALFALIYDRGHSYAGPSILGEIPADLWGISHWSNMFVDVPLLFGLGGANLYFYWKCFGSLGLPWDL